jgi:hypothetical protein
VNEAEGRVAAASKVANMLAAVEAGDIQPVEMIFRKKG